MAEGIRTPNVPLGTNLGEFLGHEIVGSTRSVKRFTRASVLGAIDAAVAGFQAGGGVIFTTKTLANSSLAYAANTMAWVIQDTTPANNGVYQKTGASGSGTWTKLAELPYSFINALNSGSGTADAVVATSSIPVSATAYSQLISVPFTAENTGSMTLAINGETPRDIVLNTGGAIPSGYVQAGMSALIVLDASGDYRLFSYGDATAIQAAAEAALASITDKYLGEHANDAAANVAAGGTPTTGALYWNTGSVSLRVYTGGAWTDAVGVNNWSADTFTGDGTSDPLTLSGGPGSANNIRVYIEGEGPQPPTIFSLAGDQLSPPSGAVWPDGKAIVVMYGSSVDVGTPADGTVTAAKLASGALADKTRAATEKTTPVDADEVGIVDSAASFVLKRLKWSSIKATLKTYFDTLYAPVGGSGNVAFPAVQVPSADPNTLDDYEEGTFTPGISFGGGSTGITYGTAYGTYTKIGRVVTFRGRITLTAVGSSTGAAKITGLPFNSTNRISSVSIGEPTAMTGLTGSLYGITETGAGTISLSQSAAAGSTLITNAVFTASTIIFFSGQYEV